MRIYRRNHTSWKPHKRPKTLLSNVLNRFLPKWLVDYIGDKSPETVRCRKCGRRNCNFSDPGPSFLRSEHPYGHYQPNTPEAQHSRKRFMNNSDLHRSWESSNCQGLHVMGTTPFEYSTVLSFDRKRIFPETVFEREMKLFRAQTLYPDASTVTRQQPIYFPRGSLLKPKYLRPPQIAAMGSPAPYLPEISVPRPLNSSDTTPTAVRSVATALCDYVKEKFTTSVSLSPKPARDMDLIKRPDEMRKLIETFCNL